MSKTAADRVRALERTTAMHFSQQDPRPEHCPRLGIDSFLRCQRGWFDVLLAQYQVAVRKRAEYSQPEQDSAHALKKQRGPTRDAKIVYAGPKFTFRR